MIFWMNGEKPVEKVKKFIGSAFNIFFLRDLFNFLGATAVIHPFGGQAVWKMRTQWTLRATDS